MKTIKLLTTFISLAFCISSVAQSWNSTTGVLYTNPLNTKVGIGLNNPESALEILGTDYQSSVINIRRINSAGWGGGLRFYNEYMPNNANIFIGSIIFGAKVNSNYSIGAQMRAVSVNSWTTNNQNTRLEFLTTNGTTTDTRMIINHNGNVGIGTTNSNSRLNIAGDLELVSNSATNLNIKTNRNDHVLRVCGGTNFSSGSALFVYGSSHSSTPGNAYLISGASNTNLNSIIQFGHRNTSGYNPYMTIMNNGNVGIGTTNPGNYKLAVNGTIRAKEVKIETNWADFVFAPGYNLRSLAEVEEFISLNGHLPEIPKAEIVEQEGVNLGEMQVKLLQKIEELTLYAIEQETRLREVNNENSGLREKLVMQDAAIKKMQFELNEIRELLLLGIK